jgi:hypothetical protein
MPDPLSGEPSLYERLPRPTNLARVDMGAGELYCISKTDTCPFEQVNSLQKNDAE